MTELCNASRHTDSTDSTNPSYKNFIALAFVLTAIYGVIYAIMRVCMVRDNIDGANIFSADFAPMFAMGARIDMRAICIFAAFVVILGYIASANRAILAHFAKSHFANRGGAE